MPDGDPGTAAVDVTGSWVRGSNRSRAAEIASLDMAHTGGSLRCTTMSAIEGKPDGGAAWSWIAGEIRLS